MMTNPLIIMALEQEAQNQFDDLSVTFSGVGKYNAAYSLTKAIHEQSPSLVINLGTAGSQSFNASELVHCRQFIQRDMDVTPLGFEAFKTPFEETPTCFEYGEVIDTLPEAICGTGDNFDVSGGTKPYTIVEMEAYVLARICAAESIPFICIKYISDGADGQAADDWNECFEQAAKALRNAYDGLRLNIK
ncbi:MAG: hypothetical protein MRY32_07185 [Rickettsiales bacterium]|nr:hypothetical protein [Rickettsiales bacterium]